MHSRAYSKCLMTAHSQMAFTWLHRFSGPGNKWAELSYYSTALAQSSTGVGCWHNRASQWNDGTLALAQTGHSHPPTLGELGPPGPGGFTPATVVPLSAGVSQAEARQPGKSPHFSMNWVVGSADVEVIDATTGKRSCGRSSRLCKHRLSAWWARLHGKVSGAGSLGPLDTGRGPKAWSEQGYT